MKIIGIGIILALMLMLSGCITTPEEPTFCTEEYAPVCGFIVEGDYSTAKTYSNACFAGLDKNVTYVEVGECKKCADEGKACTMEYMPVCGKDGITYGNKCAAEAACIEVDYQGECGNTQIANPASTYCIEQGGTLEMRENEEGQYGVCVFENFECEEWAFFRGECPVHVTEQRAYCTEKERNAEVCIMLYAPVCGYNSNEQMLETFSNSCFACANEIVEYWVNGECPV